MSPRKRIKEKAARLKREAQAAKKKAEAAAQEAKNKAKEAGLEATKEAEDAAQEAMEKAEEAARIAEEVARQKVHEAAELARQVLAMLNNDTPEYFVIPHAVDTDHLWLWVAHVGANNGEDGSGDPGPMTIRVYTDLDRSHEMKKARTPVSGWDSWRSTAALGHSRYRISYKKVKITLDASMAGRDLFFSLYGNDNCQRGNQSSARLLPSFLPSSKDSDPFRVMIGSCYSLKADATLDADEAVASYFDNLAQKPDIKILSGDQVYLDNTDDEANYDAYVTGDDFLKTYLYTWRTQLSLLEAGGNFFAADDHEFWNDYPKQLSSLPLASFPGWNNDNRIESWRARAHELFDIFQGGRWKKDDPGTYVEKFSVGGDRDTPRLSFFKAEVRIFREDKSESTALRFMPKSDLDALEAWVGALDGPGVVVLSQPFFVVPGEHKLHGVGPLTDFCLADYPQYEELCMVLEASLHDLVVVTGDLHFGRFAHKKITDDVTIFEVMSSPMRCIKEPFDVGRGTPKPASPENVITDALWDGDHFVTLDFRREDGAVSMVANAHSTEPKAIRRDDRGWPEGTSPYLIGSYALT